MASNIVFALGTFGVLKNFAEDQVAKASAIAWRGQVLTAAITTGIASVLAQIFGSFTALYSLSLFSLAGVGILLWLNRAGRKE
jgi:hypothetical protein